MIQRKILWDEFDYYCRLLADKIKASGVKYKRITAIARGGMLPAIRLSHLLDIPEVHSIGLRSYIDQDRGETKCYTNYKDLKNTLIVDDLIQTGKTFKYIYENFNLTNCHFVCLFKQGDYNYPFDIIYIEKINYWIDFCYELDTKSGIYEIINIINGKKYIGSSKDIWNRWFTHRRDLINNNHHSNRLQRAVNKYGIENFRFNSIEYVDENELIKKEQYYLDLYKAYNSKYGYNILPKAGSPRGKINSKETRKKLSKALKGKKAWNKGIPRSESTIRKIKETRKKKKHLYKTPKGTKQSEECINNRLYNIGCKKFLVYEKDSKRFIGEWINQWKCTRDLNISNKGGISACLNGKQKSCGGYIFKYKG